MGLNSCGCKCSLKCFLNVPSKVESCEPLENQLLQHNDYPQFILKNLHKNLKTFHKHFRVINSVHTATMKISTVPEKISTSPRTAAQNKKRHPCETQRISCVHGSGLSFFPVKNKRSRENVQQLRKTRPADLAWQSAAVVALLRDFMPREN